LVIWRLRGYRLGQRPPLAFTVQATYVQQSLVKGRAGIAVNSYRVRFEEQLRLAFNCPSGGPFSIHFSEIRLLLSFACKTIILLALSRIL
jgi:hypothetical protein